MTLEQYLQKEGLTPSEFARQIMVSPETVRRYVAGERTPDRKRMTRIAEATNFRVTANSFFGITA
jgi:transcriptional regulator with XRE-family HTH domain